MSKKQLIIKSFLPAIFEKKVDQKEYFGEGYTTEIVKSFCPKVLDIKKEYHSLNEEERQWITKWVLNAQKGIIYVITGFVLAFEVIALVCRWLGIDSVTNEVLTMISVCTAIVLSFSFIVLPLRNKWILKRIDFDNVQECIIYNIVHSGYGQPRSRYYALLQWDEGSQKFYEVLYMPDLPKCKCRDIVYHPYGMKIYIPKMRE